MRLITRGALLFGFLASVAFAGLSLRGGPVEPVESPYLPKPTDQIPGEGGKSEFSRQRRAWIASMRLAAPGVDTGALDAAYRSERDQRFQAQREAALDASGKPQDLLRFSASAVSGSWSERGSSNQSGRVLATAFDSAQQRLTVLSHGGNVWRANRTSLNWSSTNDAAAFESNGAQGFLLRLAGSAGERLLVLGDQPAQVRFSDNGGTSFATPGGSSVDNPWYATALVARDVAASEVYYARVHYDFTAPASWRTHLFASVDRGASFSPVAFVGERNQAALFSPRYGDTRVFLLSGTQLFTITPGTHARVPVSTVPHTLTSAETVALAGGVATGGQTFLFAFYSNDGDGLTRVYYSANAGASWTARTPAPTSMFSLNSVASSTRDPSRVFVGGVDLFRSADGGTSWTRVNPWGEYYGSPATKLHADICGIDVFVDASNVERVFVSTDGGLYESTDQLLSVQNLSLSGLNVSQYYGSYTLRQAPFHIFAGAQDQGYQKALNPGAGPQPFVQTISGDYGHLVSANGGATTWSVYPTFAMAETNAGATNQSGLRYYQFGSAQLRGTLFLPPLAALPGEPNKVLLAGGRIGGGTAHNLIELSVAGNSISGVADPFNFLDAITAVAVSPHAGATRYAMATPASASNPGARFYRRSAGTWTQTVSQLPNGQFFYGARILPDPARPGHVYVAGSGYGGGNGNAVYLSTNDGLSFAPMSTGLPSTLVLGLAISSDGQHLFAAAETGAFYYDRAQQRWIDIVSAGAPNQTYWHVDYVDELRTARFSTFGRGIWDFKLDGLDAVFANGFEP
jgi:hypothetical protein